VPVDTRRAEARDEAALLSLIAEFYVADQHPFDEATVLNGLRPLLIDDAHGQVWLVVLEGQPIGYAVVTWGWSLESGGRESLLDEIYVRSQGHGYGRVLLERVRRAAWAAGASRIFLETEGHNARVRGFYKGVGFAEEDSVWMSADLTA